MQRPPRKHTPTPNEGGRQTAQALHACLTYMARDASDLGLEQTARLLAMAADVALKEKRAA